MLSPAVRAAAAQFATSQLGTATVKAVELGYLTGYAAGYTADRTARFPLAGDQAFKRLLGQYLAENITVYHPASGRYGLLRGLPACYEKDGEPFADVEFYCDAEAREEGGGDGLDDVNKILPVLYGFEDLATEITLADGRRVVPAVEVAKLLANDWAASYRYEAELRIIGDCHIECFREVGYMDEDEETECSFFILKDWNLLVSQGDLIGSKHLENILEAYQLLRGYHFAVGLTPEQYKRKEVARD
jgi:hypothetical protein